ncbi:unnamed protein product [Prorocentrum cordatum]|uniref:Uncharacterized protein n=1 Tax=Prorocentrum cordatum TaxID=2364126 RepID=A0ABN9TSJ8_9DINO|nr:unnamed protein product [Polarella glacialis]
MEVKCETTARLKHGKIKMHEGKTGAAAAIRKVELDVKYLEYAYRREPFVLHFQSGGRLPQTAIAHRAEPGESLINRKPFYFSRAQGKTSRIECRKSTNYQNVGSAHDGEGEAHVDSTVPANTCDPKYFVAISAQGERVDQRLSRAEEALDARGRMLGGRLEAAPPASTRIGCAPTLGGIHAGMAAPAALGVAAHEEALPLCGGPLAAHCAGWPAGAGTQPVAPVMRVYQGALVPATAWQPLPTPLPSGALPGGVAHYSGLPSSAVPSSVVRGGVLSAVATPMQLYREVAAATAWAASPCAEAEAWRAAEPLAATAPARDPARAARSRSPTPTAEAWRAAEPLAATAPARDPARAARSRSPTPTDPARAARSRSPTPTAPAPGAGAGVAARGGLPTSPLRSAADHRGARPSSPQPQPRTPDADRLTDPVHLALHEEALRRDFRRRELQALGEKVRESEQQQRVANARHGLRARRQLYRQKDTRSHLEREEEILRRKAEHRGRAEERALLREIDEMRECTFRPQTNHSRQRDRSPGAGAGATAWPGARPEPRGRQSARATSGGPPASRPAPPPAAAGVDRRRPPPEASASTSAGPRRGGRAAARQRAPQLRPSCSGASVGHGEGPASAGVRQLAERQQEVVGALEILEDERQITHEELEVWHAEIRDEILREEMDRVVAMVQDVHSGHLASNEMVQRVRAMIAKGGDTESAQKALVDDLVARSQEEVQRRVHEAFEPVRAEAEANLHARELALVHELEALEAKAAALRGGALRDAAGDLGFELGLAEAVRGRLGRPLARFGEGERPLAAGGGGGAPALVHHNTPRSAAACTGALPQEPPPRAGCRSGAAGGPAAALSGEAQDAQESQSSLPADSLLVPFDSEAAHMCRIACGAPGELTTARSRAEAPQGHPC